VTAELAEKFKKYHNENPHIYDAFEKFSLIAASRRKHFAGITVINRIRWDTMMSGNDDFKVNNNYAAYYARLFEKNHPKHNGFFRKRTV